MVERDRPLDNLINEPEKTKILWEREFGLGLVVREKMFLDNRQVLLTTVFASAASEQSLLVDPFFGKHGIVTEPTGLLIDQAGTKASWGRPAGFTPEEFLVSVSGESLGICPSNAGWQYGAFWVGQGQIVSPDRNLTGNFDVIGMDDSSGKWVKVSAKVENGRMVNNLRLGLSFPLIVNNCEVAPTEDIVGDPRLVADLRNVVDFAAGKKLPNDFWLLLRKLLPSNRVSGERLLSGQTVVIKRTGAMTDDELARFQEIVEENALGDVLSLDKRRDAPRLAIIGQLPLQKIPVVGVGFNVEGKLIVAAVDGRQPDSAGVTIEQLSQIMKDRGAVCAGLGCAGGDVAVVLKKIDGSFEILNSPSNVDSTGKRITRRVPSLLVLR